MHEIRNAGLACDVQRVERVLDHVCAYVRVS